MIAAFRVLFAATVLLSLRAHAQEIVVLDRAVHLGFAESVEWKDLDGEPAQDRFLEVKFSARRNETEATLFLSQRDVKLRWPVLLNGRKLGLLELNEPPLVNAFAVPAGMIRDGENSLSVLSPQQPDDIWVGPARIEARPVETALGAATLQVRVLENGGGVPCRLTLVNARGELAPVQAPPGQLLALRTGVVYTPAGQANLQVPAGEYTLFATRGPEYALASKQLKVRAGESIPVELALRREVETKGLIAGDPHIHTFTLSRHGDATLEERMLTLAGEGVELAIASDHNIYASYAESVAHTGLAQHFTWLTGDEVTTSTGHFIAFPVTNLQAPQPDYKLTDWPALMASIRAMPGTEVVILNHPRDVHNGFIPFAPANFNAVSGDNLRGPEFTFDAVEVCNSGTLQSDFMQSFRDWFALLNHGYRVTAIGSSDSHDVSRFIVGQGRTLIAADDTDPGKIDTAAAIRALKAGRAYLSMGLLTRIEVEGKFGPGDLATGLAGGVRVRVRVSGPSWAPADRVELYANGRKVREESIAKSEATVEWTLPRPAHDEHWVVIASGPGVTALYWNIPTPYQPTGRVRAPRVIGTSNPVWIDGDGDGRYTSPRAYARTVLQKSSGEPAPVLKALEAYDEAVAAQAASLGSAQGWDLPLVLKLPMSPATRAGIEAFATAR